MADEQKTGALAKWASGGGSVAKKEEIAQALLDSAAAGGTGGGDVDYLTFSGQGANYSGWKVGRDGKKPDPDALYVIDPELAVEGWNCWKGGSVAEKHEWSVYERATQAVPQSQLKDHGPYDDGDGWSFMMGISMFDVDAPDQQIKFTTTTKSAKNVLSDLNTEIAKRIVNDEPYVPVVMLASESFVARGKTNGKPKIVVEGWVTREEVGRYIELGDDGDVEDLLSGAYAGADEAEAEPEQEEEPAPRKRRARRAAA